MSEEIKMQLADNLLVSIADEELISKVTDTENNFIERKTASDTDGWLKTAVAFANSCPIGFPGVLYIGVNNDGTIQSHKEPNFEKLQKTISRVIDDAWPPIYSLSKTLKKSDAEFIAVMIPGSPLRPHFTGQAYVRVGPETRKASETQFDELIAQRSSKFRALQKLIGQTVYWQQVSPFSGNDNAVLEECNQFFLTVTGGTYKRCFPIDWITISFDPTNKRYHLIVQSK
jgi:Putative DNA-binding domain